MVGGAVAHPAPTPEPDVTLSRHPAPEQPGHCHWHYRRWLLDRARLVNAPFHLRSL